MRKLIQRVGLPAGRYVRQLLLAVLSFAVFIVIAMPASVSAADKTDFRINEENNLAPQTAPRIAAQAGGDFVVAWLDRRQGWHEIYFQSFDSDGLAIGSNQKITSDETITERFQVALAGNSFGKYSVIWKDFRNGSFPFSPDLYQNFIDSSGLSASLEFNLTSARTDTIFDQPDIALREDGSGILVWAEHNGSEWNIIAQIFNANGSLVGSGFVVNDDGLGAQQHAPRVSASPDGWFVVVWHDDRSGDEDIWFQIYSETGSAIGSNGRANDETDSHRQAFPVVACDANDHFTVAWVDWRNGTYPENPDIYLRRYDTSGAALDSSSKLNDDNSFTAQKEPAIASDRLGNIVVVWSDSADGDWDISGQVIDFRGNLSSENFRVNSDTEKRQVQPSVALDGFDMRVVWADLRNGDFDIYGAIKRYNQPALITTPSAIELAMNTVGPAPAPVSVSLWNAGLGELDFQISDTISWLEITPLSGKTPISLSLTVTPEMMPYGDYFRTLEIQDLTSATGSMTLPLHLSVSSADTLSFSSVTIEAGGKFQLQIDLAISDSVSMIFLPLTIDSSLFSFHSVALLDSSNLGYALLYEYDTSTGDLEISYQTILDTLFDPLAPQVTSAFLSLQLIARNIEFTVPTSALLGIDSAIFVYPSGFFASPEITHGQITAGLPTDVEADEEILLPEDFRVSQNYPNPFNNSTVISFSIPHSGEVQLAIYNLLGQKLRTLAGGGFSIGAHQVEWDGKDDSGDDAPSGIYFYRVSFDRRVITGKALLLK